MATWPSGSKASTTNLDAGTDKPSLARADIKQNVDNVNSIIDMFNISAPSDGQILKYNTSNTRFELASDDAGSGGITDITAGTGITVDQTSIGGVIISNSAPATGNELENVVEDTTPQLGGNLDVQNYKITTSTNNTLTIEGKTDYNVEILTLGTGNVKLTPAVNGKSVASRFNYSESVYDLGTTSGTITPDVANGNVQTITLNGNLTFSAFSNPVAGQSLTLIIDTDGTGRTLTSTMKFAGAEKTLSTTDTFDIISVFYDGTNYFASLAKGFA